MFNLPSPTAAEVLAMHNNKSALLAAMAAARALQEVASSISPQTIIAIAQQRHGGMPALMAVANLQAEINDLAATIAEHGQEFEVARIGEAERLQPLVSSACRRTLAIAEHIQNIQKRIARTETDIAIRRQKLKEGGLSMAEIQQLAPVDNTPALQAECADLATEAEALENFLRTKDESHLPADFAQPTALAA